MTKNTATDFKIKPEIVALSEAIAKDLKINSKGEATLADPNVFEKNLPEGLTPDVVKAVTAYEGDFIAAAAHAFGHAAIPAFKAHKGFDKVGLNLGMSGKNELSLTAERSHKYPGMVRDGVAGEDVTKYCTLDIKYTVAEAAAKRGQLKSVRDAVAAAALEAYGA